MIEELSRYARSVLAATGTIDACGLLRYLEAKDRDRELDFLPRCGDKTIRELCEWGRRHGVELPTINTYLQSRSDEWLQTGEWQSELPIKSGWYWVTIRNHPAIYRSKIVKYDATTQHAVGLGAPESRFLWSGPIVHPNSKGPIT